MAGLKSNNNKALGPWTSVPFSPKLVYYYNGTKWYYPLITPTSVLTWGGYKYSYDKSVGDTFGISLSNTKYVVPNKRVSAATYDIPAGTYSPSAFENLITSFIARNGTRNVSNSFSVEVNGQTYSVSAGSRIYYTYQYSGSGRFVCFDGYPRGSTAFQGGDAFARYGVYCTYWDYSEQGENYYRYSIRVNTGINFK